MKFIKRLSFIVLALLVLLIITITIVLNTLDVNQYKSVINQKISQATGHTTSIKGNISWQLFPLPALSVNDIQINNPSGFTNEPFIKIKTISTKIQLLPLLSRNLKIESLSVDKVILNLRVDKNGKKNWEIKQIDSKKSLSNKLPEKNQLPQKKSQPFMINIKHLLISNASISFINQSTGQEASFEDSQLLINELTKNKYKMSAETQFSYQEHGKLTTKGDLSLNSNLLLNMSNLKTSNDLFKAISVDAQIKSTPLTINKITIDSLSSHLLINDEVITLKPITATLYNGQSTTELTIDKKTKAFHMTETLTAVNAQKLLSDLAGISFIDGTLDLTLNADAKGSTGTAIKRSLNGQASFSLKNGVLKNINIDGIKNWAGDLLDKIKNNQLTSVLDEVTHRINTKDLSFTNKETSFSLATGKIEIKNGQFSMDKLLLLSKQYKIEGQGTVNIDNSALKYHLNVEVLNPSEQVKQLQSMLGGSIPIIIKGSVTNPTPLPDVNLILKRANKVMLKDKVKQLGNELKNLFSH